MRRIVVGMFMTLDGVVEGPGSGDNFELAGWTDPYWHDDIGATIFGMMMEADALLLGRVTFEGFRAAFSSAPAGNPMTDNMNAFAKYVVSNTLQAPQWANSTLISGNIIEEVKQLKAQPGKNINISGSGTLVQSLMQHDLIDEYNLLVYPVVLGRGKRLFADGANHRLKFIEAKTFPTGVVHMRYQHDHQPA
jgi:dihydrofolate reductase